MDTKISSRKFHEPKNYPTRPVPNISSSLLEKIVFSFTEETVIKKSNLIGRLSSLSKEYNVSFDVKSTAYISGYASILHVTVGGDYGPYGSRAPGVWFTPSSPSATTKTIDIFSPLNGASSMFRTKAFPINEWIGVKIMQYKVEKDYIYAVHINSVRVYQVKNNDVRYFNNMKVYLGDPWYGTQPGFVRNLKIVNSG